MEEHLEQLRESDAVVGDGRGARIELEERDGRE